MKTLKLTAILGVTGLALLFIACSETENIDEGLAAAEKSAELAALQGDSCTYDGVLTDEEVTGMKLMREEEKLANNVYVHFYEMYGEVIFQNIATSEAAHMSAVLRLFEGYEIEDPALEGEGEFRNEELAKLYKDLIEEGEKGLVEALKVGATIEDLDIYDLKELLKETVNTDVKRVYENLLKGSENHMRSFSSALASLNESYKVQFISNEDYAAILSAENFSKGNGNGNGRGRGNGNKGNSGSGSGTCDGTGSGSANGTQNGSVSGNQYGNQSGSNNGNGKK